MVLHVKHLSEYLTHNRSFVIGSSFNCDIDTENIDIMLSDLSIMEKCYSQFPHPCWTRPFS